MPQPICPVCYSPEHAANWHDGRQVIVAIDPGEVHVGVALYEQGVDGLLGQQLNGWGCTMATELGPDEATEYVDRGLWAGRWSAVVVEAFRLYPDKAGAQAYSKFLTVELIGVLRHLTKTRNAYLKATPIRSDDVISYVPFVEFGADIKEPTQGMLRDLGMRSVAKARKAGGHALDAELHGARWVLHVTDREQGRLPGDTPEITIA